MKWYWLQFMAWIRGCFYQWPSMPLTPEGYSGVSCALRNWREARDMYRYGWIPWSIQTTSGGTTSRFFIVKQDEIQWPLPDADPLCRRTPGIFLTEDSRMNQLKCPSCLKEFELTDDLIGCVSSELMEAHVTCPHCGVEYAERCVPGEASKGAP